MKTILQSLLTMHIIIKITCFTLFILIPGLSNGAGMDSLQVQSPNGKLVFTFLQGNGKKDKYTPMYNLMYNGKPIIKNSQLGLRSNPNGFRNADWYKDLEMVASEKISRDTTWQPLYGERTIIPDKYNELTITFKRGDRKKQGSMQLIVRAYDEGIGFRYHFPQDIHTQILEFSEEETTFSFPAGSKAWYTPVAQATYEKRELADWKESAELPLTVELPNGIYASIAQAEMVNYPRVRLSTTPKVNVLATQVYGETVATSPYATSWRVIMLAKSPGELLQNNFLLLNLNLPLALKNTAWIKPGSVMRETTLSTAGAKKLVDFAVEQQINYIHFDAGWYGHEYDIAADATTVTVDPLRNPKGDLNLHEVIDYATSKGKGVFLYVNHRALESQIDSIFPLYKSWGIAGVKFGFVHNGSQQWNKWIVDAIKKAAHYQLMVDIHDEYRPTGLSRTYPNLLTQEGILGNEGFPDATHNTILPFTRYIAGAADYTFCFNVEKSRPGKVKTTKAHQLALPVIFYSPLQFLFWYGKPHDFPDRQEIEFWKALPTVWDDTRVLMGRPGEFIAVARKKGETWYAGMITNNQARKMLFKTDFLEAGKAYRAFMYEDDGQNKIVKTEMVLKRNTPLNFLLTASGGVAIKIVPVKNVK